MNEYDSLRIRDLMTNAGYDVSQDMAKADLIILNTCHIREKAAEKMYSELGRIKQLRNQQRQQGKELKVVVAGCVGQAEGAEIFRRSPGVDIVVGPQSYHALPNLLAESAKGATKLIELDFVDEAKFDLLPEQLVQGHGAVGLLSIQEGCDKFCTFCVVPYTRGAEFSRPVEQVYREALILVSKGAKELVLLGQNVNAYHGSGPEGKEYNLAKLISKLANIPELRRIRYTTSHPRDMDDELIAIHRSEPKLMPFLHLPVQSGSDKVLKAMNRKYTREHYLAIIAKLRESCPNIALSSDIIVGFPDETEEDFAATMSLVAEVGFSQCFSFKYSPRPGTPGALKPQISEEIKTQRLIALQQQLQQQQLAFNDSCIGHELAVLFDRQGKYQDQLIGKTPYMQSVYVDDAGDDLYGKLKQVRITKAFANSLTGIVLD